MSYAVWPPPPFVGDVGWSGGVPVLAKVLETTGGAHATRAWGVKYPVRDIISGPNNSVARSRCSLLKSGQRTRCCWSNA